jgi:hypothetical protein
MQISIKDIFNSGIFFLYKISGLKIIQSNLIRLGYSKIEIYTLNFSSSNTNNDRITLHTNDQQEDLIRCNFDETKQKLKD